MKKVYIAISLLLSNACFAMSLNQTNIAKIASPATCEYYYMQAPLVQDESKLLDSIEHRLQTQMLDIINISKLCPNPAPWMNVCRACGVGTIDEVRIIDKDSIFESRTDDLDHFFEMPRKTFFQLFMHRIEISVLDETQNPKLYKKRNANVTRNPSDDVLAFQCSIWKMLKFPTGNNMLRCFLRKHWDSEYLSVVLGASASHSNYMGTLLLSGKSLEVYSFFDNLGVRRLGQKGTDGSLLLGQTQDLTQIIFHEMGHTLHRSEHVVDYDVEYNPSTMDFVLKGGREALIQCLNGYYLPKNAFLPFAKCLCLVLERKSIPINRMGEIELGTDANLSYTISGRQIERLKPLSDIPNTLPSGAPAAQNFVTFLSVRLAQKSITQNTVNKERASYRDEFWNFEEMLQIVGMGIIHTKDKNILIVNPMCCWGLAAEMGKACRAHHAADAPYNGSDFSHLQIKYNFPEGIYRKIFNALGFPKYVDNMLKPTPLLK